MAFGNTPHSLRPLTGLTKLTCLSLALMISACDPVPPAQSVKQPTSPKPQALSHTKPTPGTPKTPAPANPKKGNITGVDMGRLFTMKEAGSVCLIDCRPPWFFGLGHIDGAANLPLKKYATAYPAKKALLDKAVSEKKIIVLYCQNLDCPDAYAVAKKLVTEGYSVSIYKGGWEEWKQAFPN